MRDWLLGIVVLVGGCAVGLRIDADHLATGWRYALGSPSESLRASAGDMPSARASVTLPHRLLHPNRAMWYARTLTLPRQPALRIDADDGAQVFVDGVQWLEDGRTFVPGEPVTPGSHAVVVRVLNNAMEGGLRSVAIVQRPRERQGSALPAVLPSGFDPVESAAFRNRMPLPGRPCRFTLWADSQGGLHTFAALIAKMASAPQDFSAGVGDLVDNGSDPAAWTRFVETLAPLARRVPLVPILGNHDYDGFYGDLISRWYQQLLHRNETWMAWGCGPARFVALDLNREFPLGIGARQRAWLEREVEGPEWRRAVWRVWLVHQPPYSRSWEGYDGDDAVREVVGDLAARHDLDMVVSGHSHAYEHLVRTIAGRPLHVLITGGAGGGLEKPLAEPISPPDRVIVAHHFIRAVADTDALEIEAVDRDGHLLDRWSIRKDLRCSQSDDDRTRCAGTQM